jgi:nitrate reductase NapE component
MLARMSFFDPHDEWLAHVMLVFGFVGIAAVAFVGGWIVGTALKPWLSGWVVS